MPRATLQIAIPEAMWIARLSRTNLLEEVRILSAIPSGARGTAVVELTAPDPSSTIDAIRDVETVADIDVLQLEDDRALLQLETQLPVLLNAARESGVPVGMPFTIRDGTATWEITTSHDRLSELGRQLETFGVEFAVDSITPDIDTSQLLTEQQFRVMETALEAGYYDTPRTCTQYELAETVGVARSTCSEVLHRAEERIVKAFMDVTVDPDPIEA
ncbi:helix-turn-helix domain-containing protein [Natronosalvus halobius]|uniref:helix-turn-helix domain-containing protein n=1 Tax=Natronosalvus halobius TaxID=2953746 RepID=UPI0020A1BB65|nr:helix-turn-helix domain-containing protein [Natronosalvus halobius]USZ72396.1 helix-turn-helix domain-containing protein [Natronosalvus halobius]